ncbi:MAG: PorV/PorQ family protein [Elusimicrobia bacterium]|nr:PorV/PorQ family protein [Elusimicrobiota bacterium]
MRLLLLGALLLSAAGGARALETAQFLKIGIGARELAMGESGAAMADAADALYWNPAGLSRAESREVAVSHAELTLATRLDHISLAQPSAAGVFGAGITYLSQSALDGRDALGHPTGGFSASDAAVSVAFARKSELLDAGASVKYLRSHIGSSEAEGAAIDAGVKRAFGALTVAAAARNLGPGMKFGGETDDLPLQLAFGAGWRFAGGHALAAEIVDAPRGGGVDAGFGGEYQALKGVYLRGGYTTQTSVMNGSGFDAARGLTLGLGLRNARWRFDYAALPAGELGTSHRFTLGARF